MSWAATAFRVCAWRYAWLRCLWAAVGPVGPGCGACGPRWGLWGLVVVPVGGGGTWLGYSRRRERAGVEGTRNSSGRPVGGARPAGPGCGACGRRRGLAGILPATRACRCGGHPEQQWAPSGRREACGAWPGFETTRRAELVARTASGRAGLAPPGSMVARLPRGSVVARLPRGSEVGRSSASGGVEVEEGY